jgi:hypothetical protein
MSRRTPVRPGLKAAVARLEDLYGPPAPPPTTDPFALVVLENAAYLVDDARRQAVFARLRKETALVPEALLSLSPAALARPPLRRGCVARAAARDRHRTRLLL